MKNIITTITAVIASLAEIDRAHVVTKVGTTETRKMHR